MASSRAHKRRQRWVGLFPRAWQMVQSIGLWMAQHPQPAILLLLCSVVTWALWAYAQKAEAFRVTHVSLPPEIAFELPEPLLGRNVWAVDLRAVSERLKRQQPSLKNVRVIRQLPNTIEIQAIRRIPVAQIHLDRWYPVDRDGFVLPEPVAEPTEGLIRLVGFGRGGSGVRVAKENADERMQAALRVLTRLQRAPVSITKRIIEVNVGNPEQISFVLEGDIEVRCGSETELDAHLKRLQAVLKALAKQQMAVRYIDVRFPEPVVGPKT